MPHSLDGDMSVAVASFQGPNRIVVVPVLEEVELFRVVNVERPHHPGLVLDLTSKLRSLEWATTTTPATSFKCFPRSSEPAAVAT
jgi:hypothetical protein